MTGVYYQAFQVLEETETKMDYHAIVTMLLRYGYEKTLLKLIEG